MPTTMIAETQLKETIFNLLKRIAPEFDFDELGPDEDIRETLDIDSFDFLQFLIGLNENLGVEVPEADYGRLSTLADLMSYLSMRVR